jgi:hypothetical protein
MSISVITNGDRIIYQCCTSCSEVAGKIFKHSKFAAIVIFDASVNINTTFVTGKINNNVLVAYNLSTIYLDRYYVKIWDATAVKMKFGTKIKRFAAKIPCKECKVNV